MAKEGVKYKTIYQILTNFYRQNSSKSIFAKRESQGYLYRMPYTRLSQEVIWAKGGFQLASKIAPLGGEGSEENGKQILSNC